VASPYSPRMQKPNDESKQQENADSSNRGLRGSRFILSIYHKRLVKTVKPICPRDTTGFQKQP
jgi:hypothetical protein